MLIRKQTNIFVWHSTEKCVLGYTLLRNLFVVLQAIWGRHLPSIVTCCKHLSFIHYDITIVSPSHLSYKYFSHCFVSKILISYNYLSATRAKNKIANQTNRARNVQCNKLAACSESHRTYRRYTFWHMVFVIFESCPCEQ